ncbi:MAG: Zn-ribbon domain-containing OB-fold protein [Thermodesulfobacteriota bacterium]|nr:Zn-ribbon domain-containing OB-fold protein [Thermodesulfobacteriota bacterium]
MADDKKKKESYIYTVDPFPQETEDQNRLYKFFDYLKEGKFTTTKCKDCGYLPWPPRIICPECLSENLEFVDMPKTGKVFTFTVQYGGVPMGFTPPTIFAGVEFDNGMRLVVAVIDTKPEEIKIGVEVELKTMQVSRDRVLPTFTLKR